MRGYTREKESLISISLSLRSMETEIRTHAEMARGVKPSRDRGSKDVSGVSRR
jgi:hypothetical protein